MMAKVQQMNEMSKQSSHFLLCNGYVTYKGKRYNDCTPAEKEVFNIVIGDVKPIDDDHEGWWHLKSTCGCYTMRLSGCYDRGILNVEAEVYKRTGKYTDCLSLTDEHWAEVEKLIEKEYNRLVKEFKEDEIFHQDEINSRNNRDFI